MLVVLVITITIGMKNAENIDEIGHRYYLVSNVDSMVAYGDSLCGPDKSFTINKLAMKWYQMAAERGSSTAMVRMGTIYREGWSDEESYWKAINCYQDAIAADSLNIEALTEAGRTFGQQVGNYKIAHAYLDSALDIDSTYLDALWYKADFYYIQGDEVEMKKIVRRMNNIDSTFVERKLKEESEDE